MGQEAGKPAWPKPTGGYQTLTGRRYGRRHAYVSFRPSLNNQDGNQHQRNGGCEGLELSDVQEQISLRSGPLVQVSSGLLDEPLLENTGTGEPVCQAVFRQTSEANPSPFSYGVEGSQISGNVMSPDKNSEDLAKYASGERDDLNGCNGIAFVNIDSYEPDSSDGEDDDGQDQLCLVREEAGVLQETLDNIVSELEKDVESLTHLRSQLSTLNDRVYRECCEEIGPVPLTRYLSTDSDFTHPNNGTYKKSAEDQAILKSNLSGASYETQLVNTVNIENRTCVTTCSELNVNDEEAEQGDSSELIVRPKIRKLNPTNHLDREKLPSNNEEESSSRREGEIDEIEQGCAEFPFKNDKEKLSSSMLIDSEWYSGPQSHAKLDLRRNTSVQEQKDMPDDSRFWDEFEECSRHLSLSHRDEDSSECSDGEWPSTGPIYFAAAEKDQSSSDESWETVPGKEEHEAEVLSGNSGIEVNADPCFHGGVQTFLEEGEIPWLQYHEEIESSSDEENDPSSDFVHPGFFMLDGNNNLEDDSSMSEDLDVEWRLLDEFGDGVGVAQVISYVDPQFFTYMALEERLAQAMENALAHLESLAVDVEQAHPPATKESIDCLPQIIVTDDHDGQEQCCTICCSEYVKDEVITELPCHHLFHKPCVTLWLQKSGTCPVCRHVLAPMLPEAAAATASFPPDDDSASSV
ncbi:E3 ubiquitin-protein ligase Praja-2 [Phasianus colchicus]|uniref:RING-type E3 ubiquitin transferase n=1 Tax=Phasianus colchicus TaxID=9054 RepID=A0A669QRD3_PHACC|nr:E3 ubiquitin-protein ligase Praja-2 [Phasianus colchicus]XP_031460893.1 E3 ubiquitin-protein ligase Praja-2 [Phasianus colchicus]